MRNLRDIKTGEAVRVTIGDETLCVAGLNGAYDPLYSECVCHRSQRSGRQAAFLRRPISTPWWGCAGRRSISC